jgi:hypothetical protein
MYRRRKTLPKQHQKPNTIHKQTNNINNPKPPIFFPDRRFLPSGACLRREVIPPVGDVLRGFGPPGKAMTVSHGEQDPAPGVNQGGLLPGSEGEAAPSLQGRETPQKGDESTLPVRGGDKIVFLDFGRSKIFAVTDDSDEVLVFNNLVELVEKLRPAVIVVDSLPGKQQNAAAELAKTGIIFLRLKDLKKLSEERKSNGVKKSDENDVAVLKTLFLRNSDDFQPLFTAPEELIVRELTEEWVTFTLMKKVSKQKRTTTNHPLAIKAHKTLRNIVDELSEEIHREAMKLPLYRLTFERLGLKGPALAHLISHDEFALKTFPRDKLLRRYHLLPPFQRWNKRSSLLLMLANTAVIHEHPRYYGVYLRYIEKFKDRSRKRWKATLRVARKILIDLKRLARENRQQTPDT